MSEENEQNPVEGSQALSGPGRRLREARESRNLTVQQVASQLRMQVRIIDALENDDYSTLPGSTFVQGYLRSYSRLLGLPEENIIGLAQADGIVEPTLIGSISEGPAEVSSRDLPFRMVSFLILALVVIGMGWWLSQREMTTPGVSPQMVSPGAEQGLLLPEEKQPLQAETELPDTENEEDATADVQSAEGASGVDSAEGLETELPLAPQEAASEPSPATVVTPAAASSAEVTPVELSAGVPQSLLELQYQADSWSEISDAAGRKLAYGLITAGTLLKLRGEAPFKVFLGYATGVTVYYNGGIYDHSTYQRGDVARFRIGRAEHNRPLAGN